ncbi:MAG: 1-acyl-sn-glycerol-3-phosphate acyltransferase [Deltaproteobacteria bacterium]|nr:1-acyl-sn-glycerol-3-phosphate acyltransferase [Deltaproteobacteria bacterium]
MKIVFYWVLYPLIRPAYLLFLIVNTAILAFIIVLISPFDRKGNFIHYIGKFWSLLNVYISGTRMYMRGRERIEKGRNYIIMSNHQSLFDVWALIGRIPLQLRWIVKASIRKMPLFGLALERMGHIYVDPRRLKDTSSGLNTAVQKIHRGFSVVIFPEGTRSMDGRLQKFHRGGAAMAIQSGVAILPVTVNGSRFVLPKGTLGLMPGKIEIVIGEPIDPSRFTEDKKDDLMLEVKEAIEKNLDLEFGRLT